MWSREILLSNFIEKADLDYSYFCNYSSTTVYFVNQVAPYLYQVDQSLVTTIEEYDSTFGCYLFVGDKSTVSWTWSKTDGTKLINNSRVSWTNSTGDSQLTITRAQLDDNGIITLSIYSIGFNSLNL